MIRRCVLIAGLLAALTGASLAAPAQASSAWRWTLAPSDTTVVTAGTACSAFDYNVIAQTRWHTTVVCQSYYDTRGRLALHWTLIKYRPSTGDYCTTDGYFYPGGSIDGRRFRPTLCASKVSLRVPWPAADVRPGGRTHRLGR